MQMMDYNKKTIIILLAVIAVIAAVFAVLLFNKHKQKDIAGERESFNIQELVGKKNNQEALSEKEKAYLEKAIIDRLELKTKELKQKPREEIISHGYTQAELDFMANPRKTVEEELGIIQGLKKIKFYTQEELDNMANPR